MSGSDQNNSTNPGHEPERQPSWHDNLLASIEQISDSLTNLADTHALAKRSESNWKTLTRYFLATFVIAAASMYVIFYANFLGFQTDPRREAAAFIPVSGPIAPGAEASAEKVVPLIERACNARHVSVVVLEISSGGGAPSEAERIISAITSCKQKTADHEPKKIYAILDGVGASAAYMIAMNADRIYAGRFTMVGSIGAIIRYNDLSGFINKHGVYERTFKTAKLKGGMSMFSGTTPEEAAATQAVVDDMGQLFLQDVLASRKGKLKIETAELYSGKVWTSVQALKYGLIDGIATREDLLRTEFKDLKTHDYRLKSNFVQGLGLKDTVKQAVLELGEMRVE